MDCGFRSDFYIKTEQDRTTPIRFNRSFSLEEEYQALQGMHSSFPDDEFNPIVKPYSLYSGSMTLEMVKGKTLAQMMDEANQEILNVIDLVDKAVERIHINGWAHGDLREENILYITLTKRLKLIDPVGYGQNFDQFSQARIEDLLDLARIRETSKECLSQKRPLIQILGIRERDYGLSEQS